MPTSILAVILAAGRGSRLASETADMPKALLPIGPRTLQDQTPTSLLRRQVELLRLMGVDRVVVVVGCQREKVREELDAWAPWVRVVVNHVIESMPSGSLHSLQFAVDSPFGVLDGGAPTLMMDADIVYHRKMLQLVLDRPEETNLLVTPSTEGDDEAVLVFGSRGNPQWLGKGSVPSMANGVPRIGEATGMVMLAPSDHDVIRRTMWSLLGVSESTSEDGFRVERPEIEHEELSQRLMDSGRIRCLVSPADLPFIEVDTGEDYRRVVEDVYPRILRMEAAEDRLRRAMPCDSSSKGETR